MTKKPASKGVKEVEAPPTMKRAGTPPSDDRSQAERTLRPVGMLFVDAAGNLVVRLGQIKRVKAGGAPKKTLRDVALTLHFEYLNLVDNCKKTAAYAQLATQFGIKGDAQKRVPRIIKQVRGDILRRFPGIAICHGPVLANRVMAFLGRHDDGTFEGYAVTWGGLNACYGRGQMTLNPGGAAGFDLDLNPEHPALVHTA